MTKSCALKRNVCHGGLLGKFHAGNIKGIKFCTKIDWNSISDKVVLVYS